MTCSICGEEFAPRGAGRSEKLSCSRQCASRRRRLDLDKRERELALAKARYAADPKRAMSRTLKWRARNPEAAALASKRTRLKALGLTVEQFDMHAAADRNCPICRRRFGELRVVVDHCHTTGQIRGVICSECNAGLGMFHDDEQALSNAIKYLAAESRGLSA